MKCLGIIGVLLVAGLSNASFELMLVADFNGRKIDRYDATTGTYLGSFGYGYVSSPTDVEVDQTTGLAYVVDPFSSSIKVFNYNTGEQVRSWSTGTQNFFITRLSSGNILASMYGNQSSRLYAPSGALIRTMNTSAAHIEGHAQTSDGLLWWIDHGGKRLMRGTETSTTPTFAYNHTNPNGQEFISAQGTELASIDFGSGTNIKMTRFATQSGIVLSETSITTPSVAGEGNGGTGYGHDAMYAALTTGSQSRYLTWMRGDGFTFSRPLSATQYAQGMAIVVAPEPTTFLAIGTGLAALIRRKRPAQQ